MSQGEKVSIVMPTYNRAYCIGAAIRSVQQQSHGDWELLIVDDGSTDDTRSVVQAFEADTRVRYVLQINGGVANARNTALRHVTGDFIAFLDSDDTWAPEKLKTQLAAFRQVPSLQMVWTDMMAVDPEGKVVDPRHLRTMYEAYRHHAMDRLFTASFPAQDLGLDSADAQGARFYFGDIYPAMIRGSLVHTSTVMVRAACVRQVGFFDENLKPAGEDYDFHFRVCRQGPVGLLDVPMIRYQVGRSDQLTLHKASTAENFLKVVQKESAYDRPIGRIPAAQIRAAMADGHAWIADVAFRLGDYRRARRFATRGLVYRNWTFQNLRLVVLTLVPSWLLGAVHRGYREIKQRVFP